MAFIKRLGVKPNYRYQVRYLDPDKRERSKTFARKVDADDFLTSVTHSVKSGSYVDPAAGRVSFKEYAEQWRSIQNYKIGTKRNTTSRLGKHVYPKIGHMPIGRLRKSDIKAMRSSWSLADSTADVVMVIVSMIFKAAVEDRVISSNPASGLVQGFQESRKVVPIEVAQVEAQAASILARYEALVMLGAMSGLRIGELCGFAVSRFNALGRQVTVDQQLVYVPGVGHRLAAPKTPASVRTIPITKRAVELVAKHVATFGTVPCPGHWCDLPTHGMKCACPAEPGCCQLIFSTERGTAVQPSPFTRGPWKTALRKAQLPATIKPHDLRHFYASALIAHGESVTTVQRRLGHKSAQTTLNLYSHLWTDADDRTRRAIEDTFAPKDEQGKEESI